MRLALIGGFGHHYLRPALNDSAIRIDRPVAIAPSSRLDDRAEALGKSLGDIRLYPDAVSLLDDYRPDLVSIGGIYGLNGDHAAAALERNIPTVCDKPIASTWSQLHRLKELTRERRRILLTEFNFRSRPEFRAARKAIQDGQVGRPILATAQKSYRFGQRPAWYADRTLYGSTLLWIASHGIDVIAFATGRKVVAVTGRHANLSHPELGSMEDHCAVMLELDGGASGVVHADYLRPDRAATHGDDRLRVAGTQGVVEVRSGRCLLLGVDGVEQDITGTVQTRPMHVDLLAAINNHEQDLYSTSASLEIAEILLHARDAADSQTWIRCGS